MKQLSFLLLAAWFCALAPAATLTLTNGAARTGLPDEVTGWSFELTSTPVTDASGTYTPWLLVTSVDFIPDGGQFPVGIFTPYMTLFPNSATVIGPDTGNGEVNPWSQNFDPILQTGVGEYHINSFQLPGDSVTGTIVVTYDSFRRSPNDPNFDPITDMGDIGLSASAVASVTVSGDTTIVPEPSVAPWCSALLLAAGFIIRRKRF